MVELWKNDLEQGRPFGAMIDHVSRDDSACWAKCILQVHAAIACRNIENCLVCQYVLS